jgi:hypothetical protein
MSFLPPDEQIELELNRIIGSPTFARAARQRALLQYLIAARRTPGLTRVKESAIALDVFERDAAKYDSATDGIVRVSAARRRAPCRRCRASPCCRSPISPVSRTTTRSVTA